MSTRMKILAMLGLAAALSPAFAHARNGERTNLPVRHLVPIPGATASTAQGRTAERAPLQPVYTLTEPVEETAGITPQNPAVADGS